MPGEVTSPTQEAPTGTAADSNAAASPPAGNSSATGGLADSSERSFALSDEVMGAGDLDEVTIPQESTPSAAQAAAAQPSEGATPTPAQAPAQPATQPPPTQQASAAQAPPASPQQAQPAQPTGPQPSGAPFDLQGELAKYRTEIIGDLASKRFALAPEDVKALEEDAVSTIPRLLARTYYEAATTAINQINNMVPRIVEHVVGELRTTNDAEDTFYREWPNLDRAAHASQVNLAANLFRQANPQATRADAIKAVGAMVTTMLGLPMPQARPTQNGVQQNGAGQRPRTPSFSPASGGGQVVSTQALPQNPFEGMGQNFDE